jgi:hypothetical protein
MAVQSTAKGALPMTIRRIIAALAACILALAPAEASLTTGGAGGLFNPNNRAFFFSDNNIPFGLPLVFNNAADVGNMFGTTGSGSTGIEIYTAAQQFFSGASGTSQEMIVDRLAYGRARIFGANILGQLTAIQSVCGNPSPCSLVSPIGGTPTAFRISTSIKAARLLRSARPLHAPSRRPPAASSSPNSTRHCRSKSPRA